MKGIVLAGGLGTRLRPLTYVTNKHLLPVYSKPMVYYPIETLKGMGITDIMLVSGGDHIGAFAELLKDGSELGVKLTYRVQTEAGGIAQALGLAEGFADDFVVILGDNYFSKPQSLLQGAGIYVAEVDNPERFGVYSTRSHQIIEKPINPTSKLAVAGLYHYDSKVFDFIKTLKPSARGELEITDVNNWYLKQGADVLYVQGKWLDMGTFDSLLDVAVGVRDANRLVG